jgi:hypothetical protein
MTRASAPTSMAAKEGSRWCTSAKEGSHWSTDASSAPHSQSGTTAAAVAATRRGALRGGFVGMVAAVTVSLSPQRTDAATTGDRASQGVVGLRFRV